MAQLTGAQTYPQGGTLDRGSPNKLLNAVAAGSSGTGNEFGVSPAAPSQNAQQTFAFQSYVAGGTLSAVSVTVEATLDGTHWNTVATLTSTTGELQFLSLSKVLGLRANVTTLTSSGGAPTYTLVVVV